MAQRAGVTFELERLDLEGDELVVSGHWSGVRGLRFVRPTLVTDNRRILATLEHKPWAPSLDREWTAAFPWDGDDVDVDGLALAVSPQVTVPLDGALVSLRRPELAPATNAKTSTTTKTKAKAKTKTKATKPAAPAPVPEAAASVPEAAAPAPEPAAPVPEPAAPVPAPPEPPSQRDRVAELEAELDAVSQERDALHRRLREAERRASDESSTHDDLARGRAAAERDRDRALDQLAEAVAAREAAVRTRDRMQAAHDEALQARDAAEAQLAAVRAQRGEANSQRDEVLLAYRGLQRHVQTERAQEDRARDDAPQEGGPDEPIGVRTMPAARTVMAELQRPRPASKLPFSHFDLWVIRVLGTVAAGCFILLLISILRVFI
ncbi:MAG: hypothetical protein QOH83_2502 [Solirubrobacteraceae bacterium]|nr:hypothetical protein [Solirubrobacteraceae bacterium]